MAALTAGQYCVASDGTHIATDGVKRYVALMTQTSTNAPVATVLENTLGGTVVWAYGSPGNYTGTLAGAFLTGKTVLLVGTVLVNGDYSMARLRRADDNAVALVTIDTGSATDDLLSSTAVDIRVYP
jgi:hypothetical protein